MTTQEVKIINLLFSKYPKRYFFSFLIEDKSLPYDRKLNKNGDYITFREYRFLIDNKSKSTIYISDDFYDFNDYVDNLVIMLEEFLPKY